MSVRQLQYYRATVGADAAELISTAEHSALGFGANITDARLLRTQQRPNFLCETSLSGNALRVDSVDAGVCLALFDVEGREAWSQDGRGIQHRQEYDAVGRITAIFKQDNGSSSERCSDRLIYGDTEPNAQDNNLRGQIIRHYDAAGYVGASSYSIGGAEFDSTRQLLAVIEAASNWQGRDESAWILILTNRETVFN
jgi:insecticidal toxin complex protein TccC